jgi:hypothetical protein
MIEDVMVNGVCHRASSHPAALRPLTPAPAGEREARRVCGKVELNITRLLHEAMEI